MAATPQHILVQHAVADLTHAEVIKYMPVTALRTQHASILAQLSGKTHSRVGHGSQGEVHAAIIPLKHGSTPAGQHPGIHAAPAPCALVVIKLCIPSEEFPVESMAGELDTLRAAANACPLIAPLYASGAPPGACPVCLQLSACLRVAFQLLAAVQQGLVCAWFPWAALIADASCGCEACSLCPMDCADRRAAV